MGDYMAVSMVDGCLKYQWKTPRGLGLNPKTMTIYDDEMAQRIFYPCLGRDKLRWIASMIGITIPNMVIDFWWAE